jgi:hypothetical protein
LELALGGNADHFQGVDVTEPLVKGVAGQLAAEAPEVLLKEGAQEVATQSLAGAFLITGLYTGGGRAGTLLEPGLQTGGDEVSLEPTLTEDSVDVGEALVEGQIVDVTDDGGQSRPKFFREWKDLCGHGARV